MLEFASFLSAAFSCRKRSSSAFLSSSAMGSPPRETVSKEAGGGSGIRTHVTVSRKHAFQACAFSHSATPPDRAFLNAASLCHGHSRRLPQAPFLIGYQRRSL